MSESPERMSNRWTPFLSVATAGLVAVETATGLAINLLPFSVTTQAAVLAHLAVALPFLPVVGLYLARHERGFARQGLTHYKLSGYLALALVLALVVSGGVLTWQAALGTRIGYVWRDVHVVSTWGLCAGLLAHVGLLLLRAVRTQLGTEPGGPIRGYLGRGSLWAGLGMGAWALVAAVVPPPTWRNAFPEGYGTPFGPERPFAPSLARTETGGAFDAESMGGSERCGAEGCHTEIYREWVPSAHRYAAMDPGFQVIQKTMAKQNGPESTRYCGGCHDPISLFSGTKNVLVSEEALTSQIGYGEGVSCIACHAIRETDVKGNAAYVAVQPDRYLLELSDDPVGAFLGRFLMRAYPARHVEQYARRMFKSPEFCAACHKQFIDEQVNQVGWVQLQNQYDNWRKSRWNHPGEAERTIECRECHMPLQASLDPAAGDDADYNRHPEDGKHRSHRFLGGNQWIPTLLKLPGGEEQVALTESWLQGKLDVPEIAEKWAPGPVLKLEVVAPTSVSPDTPVDLQIVVHSNKVGHDFPTGPLDIIQAWVQVEVKDAAGNVVFASGRIDDQHFIEPGTFMFKAEPVDQQGNLIDKHNLWEMVGVRYRRSLFPGFTDTAAYRFQSPARGPLTVEARLLYRKFDQYLLNFAFGEKSGLTSPVTPLATAHAAIGVQGG